VRINKFSQKPMIKYGNDFDDNNWLDHTQAPHEDWYFIDNPELPHLLYPNPANPRAHKLWNRAVRGGILTSVRRVDHSDRINHHLKHYSQGKITCWQELVMPRTVFRNNSRKVLLTPSSANCFKYYYNTTRTLWIEEISQHIRSIGLEPVVWPKLSRRARTERADLRLYNRLLQGDILCTVSQHSVSALESILAGVPCVVTGIHPCGDLATPAGEFFSTGELRTPNSADVEEWIATAILPNTWNKQELREGTWQES
jgi:hypothetical protein